ncbi:hypothetical protein ACO0LG_06615 [Undibacterium sp. Ji42W]|uniref:hypothetical protein n=1 Tax=Undibacterium sp. Ji42W TaxID=3413039 RepID=UPI003BF12949
MHIHSKRLWSAILLLGALSCGYAQAADAGGQVMTTDDKHVKFWAAGTPEKTEETMPERKGAPYKRTTYTMEAGGSTLMLGILEFRQDDGSAPGYETAYLNTMLDNMRRSFVNKFLLDSDGGWKDIDLPNSNLKGKQVKGRLENQDFVLRAYVAPHTIYMQQAGHAPQDKKAAEVADKFLQSLEITP